MAAYVIFIRERVRDAKELSNYESQAGASSQGHPMKVLALYGASETWEGATAEGVVILEFPNMQAARDWYNGPLYQRAKAHRHLGADYRAILVDGFNG